MKKGQTVGRVITVIGASIFLLVVAALSLSLYGESLNRTKSAVLMGSAIGAALVVAVGCYLERGEEKSIRRRRISRRKSPGAVESEAWRGPRAAG